MVTSTDVTVIPRGMTAPQVPKQVLLCTFIYLKVIYGSLSYSRLLDKRKITSCNFTYCLDAQRCIRPDSTGERAMSDQWQPPQQYDPGQYPPQQWQQPYWPPPPPVQVNVTQNAYGPSRAYTTQNMGCVEEVFHWTMILCTCGLWLPVYIGRKRSMRSVTVYR